MARALFIDKIGRHATVPVETGQLVADVLRREGIPASSVLTWVNGKVAPETGTAVRPDDYIEFRQVRHYDLDVLRKPTTRVFSDVEPSYSKAVLFDDAGRVEHRVEQLSPDRFVRFVEDSFVESLRLRRTWPEDQAIAIGLSGGRDSVALLTLLERTRDRAPQPDLVAVTVTGLPDWEEPATYDAAVTSCHRLGAEHVVVAASEIRSVFQLSRPFVEVMTRVAAGREHALVMVATHHVMRRMIEVEAERRGISVVALGLNADDLVASLVTWFTSGFPMGGIPVRQVGDLTYTYPLYGITKKELTLYLELVAPELNRQGAPGTFTSGPGERSLAYAVTDVLYDAWPGIDHYLFHAYERMQSYFLPSMDRTCDVCGATVLAFGEDALRQHGPCDVCQLLQEAASREGPP